MKKNRMMRLASLLLVCVLLTTSVISGTYAKYVTTGSASDTARVAKWGVEIGSNAQTAYASTYQNNGDTVVAAYNSTQENADKVVAPGTSSDEVSGTLEFYIKGTPEVKSEITIDFDIESDIYYGNYHPIVFTLSVNDNNGENTGDNWIVAQTGTLAEIENYLEHVYSTDGKFTSDPNVPLDAEYKLTWKWAYEGAQTFGQTNLTAEQVDTYDTILGNLAAGWTAEDAGAGTVAYSTELKYSVTITITQVD